MLCLCKRVKALVWQHQKVFMLIVENSFVPCGHVCTHIYACIHKQTRTLNEGRDGGGGESENRVAKTESKWSCERVSE